MVIDSHVHAFPVPLAGAVPEIVRVRGREWLRPVADALHRAQTLIRHLPQPLRLGLDELSGLVPLPGLLLEATVDDLLASMNRAGVDRAVLIAHPPVSSNEFVLEACAAADHAERLIPVVNVPAGTARPGAALKQFAERGARALKIHPAADGEGVDSPRYKALLHAAADLGLPVILHTGCIHTHLLYRAPDQGEAQRFAAWYERYPSVTFVLAHMNFHDPAVALDLAEEYENLRVDTSWQPAETIGEAVRRIGAERVLFGTDWPIVGDNMTVGLRRIAEAVDSGLLNDSQAALILGENASTLFRCQTNSPTSPQPS